MAGTFGDGEGSLQGIVVIEIGTSVAAPFATEILADLGAAVVKVERPEVGDDSRSWRPPTWGDTSVIYQVLNHGKESIALDFREPEGAAVLWDLIRRADVLVQNLRPGALAKAGFTAAAIREANPRLIFCDLTGFGPKGPRAGQPAYDPLLQAYSGIVSVTGEDGGSPSRVPVSVLDMGTGMWVALATLEALRRRDLTGTGSHVELSLLQTALMWMAPQLLTVHSGGPAPRRLGSGFGSVVPYGAFPASDGFIFVSAGNDAAWERLLTALEVPEADEIRSFTTIAERVGAREHVNELFGAVTSRFTVAEIERRLVEAAVPNSPVNEVPQVLADEQVRALEQIVGVEHPELDDFAVVRIPMTFDGIYPDGSLRPPPALGQDTTAVLERLGYGPDRIAELVSKGVVAPSADERERVE